MTRVSSSELALLLGVSRTRVGQYVREGKLSGCYTGDGMARRFEVALVAEALGRRLHPGQMLGNGADTRKALVALNPGVPKQIIVAAARTIPAATVGDGGPDEASDGGRYEVARTQKAEEEVRKLRRANAEAEGKFVLASEVERQVARMMAQEVAEFEAVIRDGARKVADTLGLDFKKVRQIMGDQWRSHRATRAQALTAQADSAELSTDEQAEDIQ